MEIIEDRGQLLSTAAFAIAVLLIILATILNSVIFIQNFDSRADTVGRANPAEYEDNVADAYSEYLPQVNDNYYSSYSMLETDLRNGTNTISLGLAIEYTAGGHIATSSVTDATRGTLVIQNESENLNSPSETFNTWTVASDINRTKHANVSVRRDTLANVDGSDPVLTDSFRVEMDSSTGTWTTYMYRDGNQVYINTTGTGVSDIGSCSNNIGSDRLVDVDFENGELAGGSCSQLDYYSDVEQGTYDITFSTGSNVERGTYKFTAETEIGNVNGNIDQTPPFDEGEYAKRIIYLIEYEVSYEDRVNEYTDEGKVIVE